MNPDTPVNDRRDGARTNAKLLGHFALAAATTGGDVRANLTDIFLRQLRKVARLSMVMVAGMRPPFLKLQILRSVVGLNLVNVVRNFIWTKWPPKLLGHHHTMLPDHTVRVGIGMIRHPDKDVTVTDLASSFEVLLASNSTTTFLRTSDVGTPRNVVTTVENNRPAIHAGDWLEIVFGHRHRDAILPSIALGVT